jgi:hypothetical protein
MPYLYARRNGGRLPYQTCHVNIPSHSLILATNNRKLNLSYRYSLPSSCLSAQLNGLRDSRDWSRGASVPGTLAQNLVHRFGTLAPLCFIGYFNKPIWQDGLVRGVGDLSDQ